MWASMECYWLKRLFRNKRIKKEWEHFTCTTCRHKPAGKQRAITRSFCFRVSHPVAPPPPSPLVPSWAGAAWALLSADNGTWDWGTGSPDDPMSPVPSFASGHCGRCMVVASAYRVKVHEGGIQIWVGWTVFTKMLPKLPLCKRTHKTYKKNRDYHQGTPGM